MGYTATYPRPEKTHPTPKNLVWGFFGNSNKTRPANRLQPPELHRENRPATTKLASGVFFYGYRYYDPVTGRWPSRDPIGEQGGLNFYAFNVNSAIQRFDDLGHESREAAEAQREARNSANKEGKTNNVNKGKAAATTKIANRGAAAPNEAGSAANKPAAAAADAIGEAMAWNSDIRGLLGILDVDKKCAEEISARRRMLGKDSCCYCCRILYYVPPPTGAERLLRVRTAVQVTVVDGPCWNRDEEGKPIRPEGLTEDWQATTKESFRDKYSLPKGAKWEHGYQGTCAGDPHHNAYGVDVSDTSLMPKWLRELENSKNNK